MKNIVLVGKYQNSDLTDFVQAIANHLSFLGCNVFIESETLQYMPLKYPVAESQYHYDLIIAIGGDGTMIGAIRNWLFQGIPLLGINKGRIGFLTDLNESNLFENLTEIIAGNYTVETRDVLQCTVKKDDKIIAAHIGINDVVIMGSRPYEYSLFINDEFAIKQYTTGFAVSTSTGSTAYSLNAGGSLIHPSANVLNIVPICSQSLASRPLIVSGQSEIKIVFSGSNTTNYNVDGIDGLPISSDCHFYINMCHAKFTMLHPQSYSYFENLRKKLNWT